MRKAIRDFFNKLFFRTAPAHSTRTWQTFTVFNPDNVELAVRDLKENGWSIYTVSYLKNFKTAILAYREDL